MGVDLVLVIEKKIFGPQKESTKLYRYLRVTTQFFLGQIKEKFFR